MTLICEHELSQLANGFVSSDLCGLTTRLQSESAVVWQREFDPERFSPPEYFDVWTDAFAPWLDVLMDIGQVWAFRDQSKAIGEPIHRVEILRSTGPRKQGDFHVRFLDNEESGLQEWVSRNQLVAPWTAIEAFQEDERRWIDVLEKSDAVYGTPAFSAAKLIFAELRPKSLVRFRHTRADAGVIEILDVNAFVKKCKVDPEMLLNLEWVFTDRHGTLIAPWPATRVLAQQLAQEFGGSLLEQMLDREKAFREELASNRLWSSQQERYDKELKGLQPIIEVLREWCGAEEVERYDELRALQQEVERLGELVLRAVQELRSRKFHAIAATIERDLGAQDASSGSSRT